MPDNKVVEKLKGTAAALITPMNQDGSIDFDSLDKLIEHLVGKLDYLVVNGTTGEPATLTYSEEAQILNHVIKKVNKRLPIVYGLGSNATHESLDHLKNIDFEPITAVLSISPYYNKPSQEGLINHYTLLAKNCPVPLILYNVPGRTASNITAATTLELAKHPNIIGIKEASGNLDQIIEISAKKPNDFLLISGDDKLTLSLLPIGCQGVISVIANAFPSQMKTVVDAGLEGNWPEAKSNLFSILELIDIAFAEGSPVGIKAILNYLGICKPYVRNPLVPASENLVNQIKANLISRNF